MQIGKLVGVDLIADFGRATLALGFRPTFGKNSK
jgi:hypothetical protein